MQYLLSEEEYKALVPKKLLIEANLNRDKLIEVFRQNLCYKRITDDCKNDYFICDRCPLGFEEGNKNGTDVCPDQEEVSE